MITIRDVAKTAGLSVGTVSNVLNGVPSVSSKNCEKVNAAIIKLGYRRNDAASQLRSRISKSIGLIIPDITNPFYPEIARGVEDVAKDGSYNVFLCNKDRSVKAEELAIETMLSKKVDGVILIKPKVSPEVIKEIKQNCAVVLMDADPGSIDCDIINVDDYAGMFLNVQKAVEFGHRRIAYISGLDDSLSSQNRQQAFHDAMLHFGVKERPGYFASGIFTLESGISYFQTMMSLPEPPTVILTANDQMAKGAMFEAHNMGKKIPSDISIIGYDDIYDARWTVPPLTTTWYPKYEMGCAGAQLLLRRISERRNLDGHDREVVIMKTKFCMRESLGSINAL